MDKIILSNRALEMAQSILEKMASSDEIFFDISQLKEFAGIKKEESLNMGEVFIYLGVSRYLQKEGDIVSGGVAAPDKYCLPNRLNKFYGDRQGQILIA